MLGNVTGLPILEGDPCILQKGSSVFLETIARGDPKPTAAWFKDSKDIKESDKYKMKIEDVQGKYNISCELVSYDKPDAGEYKVTLTNSKGAVSATFTVTSGDAPEMVEKPKIVQRDGGNILGIKVHTKSKTDPTFKWEKDDKPVAENDRVKFSKQKEKGKDDEYIIRLEITGPKKEDEGKYKCIVENKEGSNSQSLNLSFD